VVLFMVTTTYPLNKATEVMETFLKVAETKPPPYLKSRGFYNCYGGKGIKSYNIVEIEDAHIAEGAAELQRRLIPFNSIEGLEITFETLMTVRESIELARG